MSMVYFFVPGKVQGKARPRFSSRSGTVYTPGKTKSYERQIAEAYEAQRGSCFEGPVMVVIEAVFPIPKSWTRAKKAEALAGKLPPGKPDIDNILKVVLDGRLSAAFPAGRRTPSAFVPLRSTAGRRPLQTFTDGVPGLTQAGRKRCRPGGEIFRPADGRPTTAYSVYVEEV